MVVAGFSYQAPEPRTVNAGNPGVVGKTLKSALQKGAIISEALRVQRFKNLSQLLFNFLYADEVITFSEAYKARLMALS